MTSFAKRCQPATAEEMKIKSWISWFVLAVMIVVGAGMGFRLSSQQTKLKESQERYNLAVAGSGVGLWHWDITENGQIEDYDHVWYSDQFLEMLGVTREEWPNQAASFMGRLHPDDVQLVRDNVADHVAGRTSIYEATFRLKVGDNGYRWFHVHGKCDHDRLHMSGSLIDIHDAFEQRRRS